MLSMKENDFTMNDIMKNSIYRTNLIIMVLSWSASSFCFYILSFYLKYIPGDIFINTIIVSVADLISSLVTGLMAQWIGAQRTMTLSFLLSTVGGFLLIFAGDNELWIMIFMLFTRFGINICFTLCYIINAEYFPAIVCSSIFGICNIFSRISTILSPLIAEIKAPVPMIIYIFICMLSTVSSLFLTKNEEADEAMKDLDDTMSYNSKFTSSLAANLKSKDIDEINAGASNGSYNYDDQGDLFVGDVRFDLDAEEEAERNQKA